MAIPPITHYKDEVPSTNDLINQEIDKEVESAKTPELKVIPIVKNDAKNTNVSNIVNVFRQKMSTNTMPIELPSVGKTVEFKEIDTKEQKELSKIALENDSRSDIMYCSMLGLINRLACEKNFDIRDYTEFERIAVTLNLQQMNKMNPEIKFTCPKCGKENSYKLDTNAMLRKFNKTYKPDVAFEVESGNRKFTFVTGWASVRNVEDFFKHYYKKYDNSSKTGKETMNNLSQIEYITMFIKNIALESLSDPDDKITADLTQLKYYERAQIIDCLPQTIVFDDNTGIVSKIIETYVTPMNKVFQYNDCAFCGAEQEGQMANITDFIGA